MKSNISRIVCTMVVLCLVFSFSPVSALSVPQATVDSLELLHEPIKLDIDAQLTEPFLLSPKLAQHSWQDNVKISERKYIPPSPEDQAITEQQVQDFNCSSVSDVPPLECESLVALYDSTNGAGWVDNTNWLITTTVDDWYGVTVTNGYVTQINLLSNQLTGNIPSDMGNLSYLQMLKLHYNQLSGSIPSELGNLGNLLWLELSNNYISGSVPSELGSLTNLQWLDLSNTHLSGMIPLTFINLTHLSTFYFNYTNLCEPMTPDFLAWKSTVLIWFGSGLICECLFLPLIVR